jgi:hypothetical protein
VFANKQAKQAILWDERAVRRGGAGADRGARCARRASAGAGGGAGVRAGAGGGLDA